MTTIPNDYIDLAQPESASSVSSEVPYLPEDLFAGFHLTYFPRFKKLTQQLGKTRLLKLIWAIGDVPNVQKLDKNFTKEQKEAFLIMDKLLLAKFSLVFNTLFKETEKQQAESVAKEVVPQTNTEESTNG